MISFKINFVIENACAIDLFYLFFFFGGGGGGGGGVAINLKLFVGFHTYLDMVYLDT